MRRLFLVLITLSAIIMTASLLSTIRETAVSAQQTSKGWRVWIRTSPCSGRFDWLSVARESPDAGASFYVPYETELASQGCTQGGNLGCTFAQANALMEKLRGDAKFFDHCCRDYSVWENLQSKKRSIVVGRSGTAGAGWQFVKGNLCCEDAEQLAGIPGSCGGVKTAAPGWGPRQEGSINQGDGKSLTAHGGTTPDNCQAACDKNPRCVAFTFIRPGGFSPGDPAMCYLMSEAKKVTPSTCCVTAIKNKPGVKK